VFRTALSVLLAGAALTACGQVKMGTAATVGDERVSTARLDSTVAQWEKEFARNPQAGLVQQQAQQQNQQIPFDPDSPRRSALMQLIDFEVWKQVAKERGVNVTQGQVDGLLAGLGGQSRVAASVLANDVPLRYTPDFARSAVIQRELVRQFGINPDAQQGQVDLATQQRAAQQLSAAYTTAAQNLDVRVNPRFGTFDARQVTLGPVGYRLSKTEPGTG
jgi:hypothetical protein